MEKCFVIEVILIILVFFSILFDMSFFFLSFFRFICPALERPGIINLDLPLEMKRLRFILQNLVSFYISYLILF